MTPMSRDSVGSDGGGQWRWIGGGHHGLGGDSNENSGRAGLSGGGFNESYYSDDRQIMSDGSNSGNAYLYNGLVSLSKPGSEDDEDPDSEHDASGRDRIGSTISL